MERLGMRVDGVCAGRYSDVPPRGGAKTFVQTTCRVCGCEMKPQVVGEEGDTVHQGEGLCGRCYPVFSRKIRKGG